MNFHILRFKLSNVYIYNVYIIEYIELERKREKLFYTLECLFDTTNCKSIC